jgi:hypothetical protein
LATYPKINARTDPIHEMKKAKTAIARHTIPRTIDAIARPLLRPVDPYDGDSPGGPADGGPYPNGGADGGGP